jgi:hypothetical protein
MQAQLHPIIAMVKPMSELLSKKPNGSIIEAKVATVNKMPVIKMAMVFFKAVHGSFIIKRIASMNTIQVMKENTNSKTIQMRYIPKPGRIDSLKFMLSE